MNGISRPPWLGWLHAWRWQVVVCLGLCTAGCAVEPPLEHIPAAIPARWQAALPAPLPHGGSLVGLSQWWDAQKDPLLVELIMAAQAVSPSVASAQSNIEQARATRAASGAALLPALDATANVSRSLGGPVNRAVPPISTNGQVGL